MSDQLRLSRRVLVHLDGTGLFQGQVYSHDADEEAIGQALRAAVEAAPRRADGSVGIRATPAERDVLRRYIEGMEMGGRDNAWDPDGLADLNAARALLRRLRSP